MELVKADNMTASFAGMSRLPVVRQLGLLFGLAASIALGAAVVMWSQQPNFGVLYSNLNEKDASQVVQALQQKGIKYKLDPVTGAIMVPADAVPQVRLQLADAGLPKSSGVGFDMLKQKQEFGTSQFIENARYQHALEQELARSVMTINAVQAARVHLAMPKQSVFVRKRQHPTASVLVNLYPGRTLDDGQVSAITHLVASSIPNLDPERVTVVDQKGELLTGPKSDDGIGASQDQFKYTRELENAYSQRIENILSPIVGSDGVRAQVTADLDFTRTEQTQETYNPDLPALRSEQTYEEKSTQSGEQGIPGALSNQPPGTATAPQQTGAGQQGKGQAAAGQTNAQTTTSTGPTKTTRRSTVNYELDRTISHSKLAPGQIKRLSVAVVVNDQLVKNKDGKMERQPLPQPELDRITALVKDAVGFDAQRGDTVNVINASFKSPEPIAAPPATPIWKQAWVWDLAKQVFAGLVVLFLVLFVLRPVLRSLATVRQGQLPAGGAAGEGGGDMAEDQLTLSGGSTATGRLPGPDHYEENLGMARQMAQQDPKRVAQVVKNWIATDQG